MAIYSGFTHQKWWFSIVFCMFTRVCIGKSSQRRAPRVGLNRTPIFWLRSWLKNPIDFPAMLDSGEKCHGFSVDAPMFRCSEWHWMAVKVARSSPGAYFWLRHQGVPMINLPFCHMITTQFQFNVNLLMYNPKVDQSDRINIQENQPRWCSKGVSVLTTVTSHPSFA